MALGLKIILRDGKGNDLCQIGDTVETYFAAPKHRLTEQTFTRIKETLTELMNRGLLTEDVTAVLEEFSTGDREDATEVRTFGPNASVTSTVGPRDFKLPPNRKF